MGAQPGAERVRRAERVNPGSDAGSIPAGSTRLCISPPHIEGPQPYVTGILPGGNMRKLLFTVLMAPLVSYAWNLNDTINNTNFIVDDRCSGTLVDMEYRLVLTNHHCIRHKVREVTSEEVVDGVLQDVRKERLLDVPIAQKSYVGFEEVGSSEYITIIVAKDKNRDLALLQIKDENIPYTIESPILPETMKVVRGETAYAVGNPRMLDASVTKGIISSVTRQFRVPWANGEKVAFLQFDGGIVGGNSGGALYNVQGYMIGVPAAGAESTVGLAIPAMTVREFLSDYCWSVWQGATLPEHCQDFGEEKEEEEGDTKGS